MRHMGLIGMAPGPNTSRPHPDSNIYPYLLRGVSVVRPNQVWSIDITYIRLAHGFAYLVAIMDWYSRRCQLEDKQQHGSGILCLLPGGSLAYPWYAGNIQQRSRFTVHKSCIHQCAETGKHPY